MISLVDMMQEKGAALTFDQASRLCTQLVPLGDRTFDVEATLIERGFKAFSPYHEFVESFGDTEEIELHRRCLIEEAKLRLGRPWPMRISAENWPKVYSSGFIKTLRDDLYRQNGVTSEAELNSVYPGELWRGVVDPCEQNKLLAAKTNGAIFESQRNSVLRKIRYILDIEAEREASGLSATLTFDRKGSYEMYRSVMRRHAEPLGFYFDRQRSRQFYPLFAKRISDHWLLTFSIKDDRKFSPSPSGGIYEPSLMLRTDNLTGRPVKAMQGQILIIDYAKIVFGFVAAYWKFESLDDLELAIKAHLLLYTLCSSVVENAILEELR